MYEVNLCSPIWDSTPMPTFNLTVTRLLMITILFLLYLMYIVLSLILTKIARNLKSEDSGPQLKQQQILREKWEKQYMHVLGDHSIAIGFVICFSPYQFETILSIVYFLLRLLYEIKLHKFGIPIKFIKTILRIINLTLFICAMIGLSRTQFDRISQNCRDIHYRF